VTGAPGAYDDLRGKVAVVTGAGHGIGAASAARLADLGAHSVLLEIDGERLAATVGELSGRGLDVSGIECDVADERSVEAAVAAVRADHGRCDALVNNAGIIEWSPLEELDRAGWDRTLAVNLTGCFLCARGFGALMLERGAGSVVNVASVAGSAPEALAGSYSASKAGAIMLARQIALEWGPRGVRGNAVSPGIFAAPMAAAFNDDPDSLRRREQIVPVGRIGRPEELAAVVAFLASDASSFVNGQNIEVDGGMMQALIRLLPHPGVPGYDDPDGGDA
jgi:NAD(P)-dependent dehydrogenase (short-subunit alcohol dehydrogenase family)